MFVLFTHFAKEMLIIFIWFVKNICHVSNSNRLPVLEDKFKTSVYLHFGFFFLMMFYYVETFKFLHGQIWQYFPVLLLPLTLCISLETGESPVAFCCYCTIIFLNIWLGLQIYFVPLAFIKRVLISSLK